MPKTRIALLTDSGTNTPAEFCEEHDIRVAPLQISYQDGSTYESGVDITPAELVERLADEIPKTSLPAPAKIRQMLEQAQSDGYDAALFVTISSGLSATYETVRMVAQGIADFPVSVVDTKSIGVSAGLVVMEAANLIERGLMLDDARKRLTELAARTKVYFSTKTLEYLRAGGRISEAVYRLGSLLNIKPVITCDKDGKYVVAAKARGWARSLEQEVRLACKDALSFDRVRLAICCSVGNEHFEELEQKFRERLGQAGVDIESIVRAAVSADLLVHTGPDVVGVAVQGVV